MRPWRCSYRTSGNSSHLVVNLGDLISNLTAPASAEFLQWLHSEFYRDAPESMLAIRLRRQQGSPVRLFARRFARPQSFPPQRPIWGGEQTVRSWIMQSISTHRKALMRIVEVLQPFPSEVSALDELEKVGVAVGTGFSRLG